MFDTISLKNRNKISNIIIAKDIDPNNQLCDKDLNEKVCRYFEKAIVIPLKVNNDKDAEKIEKEIGNWLIKKGVPILNKYSHCVNELQLKKGEVCWEGECCLAHINKSILEYECKTPGGHHECD